MEALYAKLYKNYTKLKEANAEMEKLNREQEEKLLNRISASDKLIDSLKSERDELCQQVHELKSELVSLRATKDEELIRYQKLLREENLRNKDLSMEIEKLRTVEQERQDNIVSRDYEDESGRKNYNGYVSSHARRRRRQSLPLSIEYPVDETSAAAGEEILDGLSCEPDKDLCKMIEAPCRRRLKNDSENSVCMFQELIGCIVGMKISPLQENEESSISVLHEPTGYAFTLKLIDSSGGGEAEWVYRLSSLGTLKSVSTKWMRESVIRFSTSMCPIFFQRLSRVILLCS
ncbi:hypothetical protein DM860_013059 [Cuscuta australis]|uniref:DUF7806 domain-containing protein n=1 Tax=Cuscuta australis TaxID=267555 RepID=A0A328D5Z0_9ASTE|nr:hypothetical protein DM860_013059 [Cuscuta australis]